MNYCTKASTNGSKSRIEYMDALRGVSILLVVMIHVGGFCLKINSDTPSLLNYLSEFFLALFFFISGYMCLKKEVNWSLKLCFQYIIIKFLRLIVPFSIFLLASSYINENSFLQSVLSDPKGGYWYPFVLFEFYIIFVLISSLATIIKLTQCYTTLLYILCGLLLFVVTIPLTHMQIGNSFVGLISFQKWNYFIYFAIGLLVRKEKEFFDGLLDSKYFLLSCLVLFFVINIFRNTAVAYHYNLFRIVTAVSGVFILYGYFRMNSNLFSSTNWLGKGLCYIGRRTLDIYFLHYFFLPVNLSVVLPVLTQYPIPIIEFAITLSLSLFITLACLFLSSILRSSSILASLLFGEKF